MTTQDKLTHAAFALRGRILELSIQMENFIDIYISETFTDDRDKQSNLVFVVLCHIGLSEKENILGVLLKRDDNNRHIDSKELIKRIERSITIRNTFAHWTMDFSPPAIKKYEDDGTITLVKRKPSSYNSTPVLAQRHLYSEELANSELEFILAVNKSLMELIKL